MNSTVDKVAEAMYKARERRIPWEQLSEMGWKNEYRCMARAAIEALELTEEWGVWTDDGDGFVDPDGWITDDPEEAMAEAETKCLSCNQCRNSLPKHVISRLVSPWIQADL